MDLLRWFEKYTLGEADGRPRRLVIRRTRTFDRFLGRCGVDIHQVVNAEGGLQNLLVAFRRIDHQVEEFRALSRSEDSR